MTTRPTRAQERARNHLVDALASIAEAVRLDDRAAPTPAGLAAIADRLAGLAPGFAAEALLSRALESRARAIGLTTDALEMLTLLDEPGETPPAALLLMDDDAIRDRVAALDEELGGP